MHATNIELWVEYICGQPVPVLNQTIQSILHICNDEHATCKQLADVIIQDPAFAARVLHIANSAYYNRTLNPLSDIRRAVLLIGFQKILGITLTLSIVDTLVNKSTLRHIVSLMRTALQTAVLARAVAEHSALTHADEIFVAGLFHDIGEIAFWSLSGRYGATLSLSLDSIHLPAQSAQREILGVTFADLSIALADKWQLSSLLKSFLQNPQRKDPYIQCLVRSYDLIRAQEQEPPRHQHALAGLASFLKLTAVEADAFVQQQFNDAALLVHSYTTLR